MSSRLSKIDKTPKDAATAKSEEEARREDIMDSAFRNIFDSYGNEGEIAKVLTSANTKAASLRREMRESYSDIQHIQDQVEKVCSEVNNLMYLLGDATRPLRASVPPKLPKYAACNIPVLHELSEVLPMINERIRRKGKLADYESRLKEARVELEIVEGRIKILEVVKAAASTGILKRQRGETLNTDAGNAEIKRKRTGLPKSEDSDGD